MDIATPFDPPAEPRRGPGERRQRPQVPVYAAIDLGTNNCRLLVARPNGNGFRVVDAFSRIVRLGEGVGASGRLSDQAVERTVAALKICATKMRRRGVTRARSVATAACRHAQNGSEFLERVRGETGLAFETISPEEEAQLAVAGCRPLIVPEARHALIFDIGGGSTELTWLELTPDGEARLGAWISMPHGVVSLAEHFERDDPATAYGAMVELALQHLHPFEARIGLARRVAAGSVQMLGTSGTVTTLAGVHLDLPRYDRNAVDGSWLSFDEAVRVADRLRAMSGEERARHPCIGRERADLVVAGCAVLEAICRTWPVGRLRVGDRGLREGLLLSLMRADGVLGASGAQA